MVSMTSTSQNRAGARRIDHCVLPVADLAGARDRLTRLGFTVAPEGRHPFGTHNACVYFADDTFLEPLAVGDRVRIVPNHCCVVTNLFDRAWLLATDGGVEEIDIAARGRMT